MQIAYNELAHYNNGQLVYKWFDLDNVTKEEHFEELREWLESLPPVYGSPCEEWCVGDVDNVPRAFVSDFGLSEEFWQFKEVAENSGLSWEVFEAAIDLGIAFDMVEELYQGEYYSDRDFAQEFADQIGAIDGDAQWPQTCIDWDQAARELMYDYGSSNNHYFRTSY